MMHPAMAIVATIVNEKTAQRSVSNMAMAPSTGNVVRSDDGQMTLRHDGSRGRARTSLIRSRSAREAASTHNQRTEHLDEIDSVAAGATAAPGLMSGTA